MCSIPPSAARLAPMMMVGFLPRVSDIVPAASAPKTAPMDNRDTISPCIHTEDSLRKKMGKFLELVGTGEVPPNTHTCTHTHAHTHMHTQMHACIHTHACTHAAYKLNTTWTQGSCILCGDNYMKRWLPLSGQSPDRSVQHCGHYE